MSFAPIGRMLLADGRIWWLDAAWAPVVPRRPGEPVRLSSGPAVFSRTHSLIYVVDAAGVRVFDPETRGFDDGVRPLPEGGNNRVMVVDPDGDRLLIGTLSGDVVVVPLCDGRPGSEPVVLSGPSRRMTAGEVGLGLLAAGALIGSLVLSVATGEPTDLSGSGPSTPGLQSRSGVVGLACAPTDPADPADPASPADAVPDVGLRQGPLVAAAIGGAVGGRRVVIRLWDARSGIVLDAGFGGNTSGSGALAFSPGGSVLAMAAHRDRVALWDVRAGRRFATPLDTQVGAVRALVFSPDGTALAVGGRQGVRVLPMA